MAEVTTAAREARVVWAVVRTGMQTRATPMTQQTALEEAAAGPDHILVLAPAATAATAS